MKTIVQISLYLIGQAGRQKEYKSQDFFRDSFGGSLDFP
jgi:hypothetical protein